MDNADIFVFTLFVVPAFIVFAVMTIREFSRAGAANDKLDADTRFK